MEVEFVGQSNRDDDNSQADPSRLLNCYRERHGQTFIVKSVLGTQEFVTLSGVFMRAMNEVGGEIYAAHGGSVYRIAEDMTVVDLGSVTDDTQTTISGNNGAITVSAGGTYYNIASDGTLTTPATGAFTGASSVSFLGQRTIITEPNGRRFSWSDVADSTTINALNFATAETEDDNIIRGAAIGGQYWIFSERSVERWYVSGSSNVTEFLLPISGAADEIGLKSFGLFTKIPNGAFYVGSDNIPRLISGGTSQPVSNRAVETSIAQSTPDRCFYYEDEGHKFCGIRFLDRPAWFFDISGNEWHERAEGATFAPWSAVSAVQAYGKSFVGTDLGGVYELTRNNQDVSGPLLRRAVSRTAENAGEDFIVSKLQMRPRVGRSNLTDLEGNQREARAMFRISRDRGETWGAEKWRDLGKQGEYLQKTYLRALGQFDTANFEITISEPSEIPFDSRVFLEVA